MLQPIKTPDLSNFIFKDTSLLRQTIHYDTSLYRLQATNECVTATSCFDILFQILLSSQCAPLQVNETKKDYHTFIVQLPYERPRSPIDSIKIELITQTDYTLIELSAIDNVRTKITSYISKCKDDSRQ
ncbi:unnamed protein product [Rotaria sp. Silwood1]|nr:unnamed protein product [Rotaria sp. Silwood1]